MSAVPRPSKAALRLHRHYYRQSKGHTVRRVLLKTLGDLGSRPIAFAWICKGIEAYNANNFSVNWVFVA